MKLTIQSFWSGILVSLIAINLYSSQKKSVEELLKYNKSLKHEYLRDECKKETLNIERIQKYLELKANPNKFQSVHALLSFNHKSLSSMHTVLELLIRHNADLTKKDFIWRTPLHCLAENEAISYETLKLLFDNKAIMKKLLEQKISFWDAYKEGFESYDHLAKNIYSYQRHRRQS